MKAIGILAATTFLATAPLHAADVAPDAVVSHYADLAQASYEDSRLAADRLASAINTLLATPSPETMQAAREAWRQARVPYMQTEAFRFGNPIVDEWEGRVNSWPLDEGFIDYVAAGTGGPTDENPYADLNVIANDRFTLSAGEIDATTITPALLRDTLQEADAIESNVATGYHAIEFLLWGQDLNGTAAGAGNRPWTDYVQGDGCTGGHCDRRAAYLQVVTGMLVEDLGWMADQWKDGGAAREAVVAHPENGVIAILTGMGSLSYGELAGERMRLGVMLHDPEEEQDCFSDNTFNSHYYDGISIRNVYLGHYVRSDGSILSGPSVSDLVAAKDQAIDQDVRTAINNSVMALGDITIVGEQGTAYDQLIGPGNAAGEALVMNAVNALIAQTRSIERAVATLDLQAIAFEGSDSLDNPDAVFQ